MEKEKFYITTAIAYTSKKPHIGNTYEVILTDAIARFKKMQGKDVFFLTGTDEHGQKIQEIAESFGITPKEYTDKIAGEIKNIWDLMDTEYDFFMRTTDAYHEEAVQKIFEKLYNQDDIYLGEYEGLYCTPCESFFTDSQLVDGKCPDCGREVKKTKEEAYFLRCSKYQKKLMEYIYNNPGFIEPEARKKEIINNFLIEDLPDLCVSRTSFTWGIPVKFNPKHVTYVWIDALSNYITAIGYSVDKKSEKYEKYWPADLQIIGKDILRFHAIYWPIMLIALGEPLPKKIYAHGWMLFGNDKMSKSKGNVIYADDLARDFGVDATRFYCLSEMPYATDGNITHKDFVLKYNSELANTLGNLVNRTIAMIRKYFDGVLTNTKIEDDIDSSLKDLVSKSVVEYEKKMNEYKLSDAIDQVWNIVRRSNKYIDETTPWILAKDESKKERLQTVLYNLAETIRIISVMLSPIMPSTSKKIQEYMSCEDNTFDSIKIFGKIQNKTKVKEAKIMFERIEEKEVSVLESKDEIVEDNLISIDEFSKINMKVVKIISAEQIEGSDKLYKIEVDLGNQIRQVVSGLVKYYTAAELVGKKVILVTNLKPATLKGVISQGMILAAGEGQNVKIIEVDDTLELGSSIS